MDEVFKSDVHYQNHTDVLTHVLSQPTEKLILDRNAEIRKDPSVLRGLGEGQEGGKWGDAAANIPLVLLDKANRDGFDIYAKDSLFASSELLRFLKTTPEGRACLLRKI
jgi:hypothetical protein